MEDCFKSTLLQPFLNVEFKPLRLLKVCTNLHDIMTVMLISPKDAMHLKKHSKFISHLQFNLIFLEFQYLTPVFIKHVLIKIKQPKSMQQFQNKFKFYFHL